MLSAALLVLVATAPGAYDPLFHGSFEQNSSCPAGRQIYSDMGYVGDNNSGDLRYHVDLREWENIWGHASPYDSTAPWPGRSNSAPIRPLKSCSTAVTATRKAFLNALALELP